MFDPALKTTLIGLVYRVENRDGSVLTSADAARVSAYVEHVIGPVEEHEFQRIDGTHVVSVDLAALEHRPVREAMSLREFVDRGAHVDETGAVRPGEPRRPLTNEEERQLDALINSSETTVADVQQFLAGRVSIRGASWPLLERLEQAGFTVTVEHRRLPWTAIGSIRLRPVRERASLVASRSYPMSVFRREGNSPSPKGGVTFAKVERDSRRVASAQAVCSIDDNFVYRVGLVKALGRLTGELKRAGIDVVP